MTTTPDIALPAELRPQDGRFGSGPSKVDAAALDALAATGTSYMGTSHRQSGVRNVVRDIRHGLRDLYELPSDWDVLFGVGGATAVWDALAFGFILRKSQHLVFGEFSGKFAAAIRKAPHLEDPEVLESEPGSHPRPQASAEIDVYAFTHNETSTGVMMPLHRPAPTGLVAVDATSAAGAVRVRVPEFDFYYFSPQKAFGADGGLWMALASPVAVDRIELIAASGRHIPAFLSLKLALDNSRKDQTYNTPALATLFIVRHQIAKMLDAGGLRWAERRCRTSSSILYDWAETTDYAAPFVTDEAKRSTTVVTIDLDDAVSADNVVAVLRANDILDISGYRKLGRNQLRIACFPNIEPADVEVLTQAIDYVVAHLSE